MNAINITLYFMAFLAALLGLLVFLRNARGKSHKLFLAICISCSAWILSNALFNQAPSDQIAYIVALTSYAFAALLASLFFFFAVDIANFKLPRQKLIAIICGVFIVLAITPGVLATGVVNKTIVTTPILAIFGLGESALLILGTVILLKNYNKSDGRRRQQLGTVLIGLIGSIIGGLIFNLILPMCGNYEFVQIGPAFSILFISASSYAIFKHKLFDLRKTIVRLAIYFLALLTVFILYVITAYALIVPFFGNWLSPDMRLVYPLLAVGVALTFQPIKNFFDAITKSIFFKNSYDSEKILDALGKIIVAEVDINQLLKHSVTLLKSAVKPFGIEVIVVKGKSQEHDLTIGRLFKDSTKTFKLIKQNVRGLIVVDDLIDRNSLLYNQLSASGVGMVAPLVTSSADLGYLIISNKASGEAFTNQDIDLVRIFADELAVAAQNTLRYEEISHFNVTLKEEVLDATSQLRDSNKKLQRLDEAKDEFISMASHQLRTPLTSVKGYLSMALEGDGGPLNKDQKHLLNEAYSSAQRMVYLIGDFLNVSRLQTGKFVLETAPANLANIIAEEVQQLEATASMRKINLVYHKPSRFPLIIMDEGKMRQVLMNFIDNAIFYSKPDESVQIELSANAKEATLMVRDSGIGVPPTERHRIFTKFFRASNARKVRPDGTGIGLYMAKKVVAAHGGSIIFETKEGKGSTFGFILPLNN